MICDTPLQSRPTTRQWGEMPLSVAQVWQVAAAVSQRQAFKSPETDVATVALGVTLVADQPTTRAPTSLSLARATSIDSAALIGGSDAPVVAR